MSEHVRIRVAVRTFIDREPVSKINNEDVTYTQVTYEVPEHMKDKYKQLLGDMQARVSMSVDEKIGGPGYSSVGVHAAVTLSCNQDEESIKKASELAFAEAMRLVDEKVVYTYEVLLGHLRSIEQGG